MVAGCGMIQPILLNEIMEYIGGDKTWLESGLYFLSILAVRLVLGICLSHFYYRMGVFGFKLSNTLSLLIYSKALKQPLLAEKDYSVSDIVNYSQADAQRMNGLPIQLSRALFAPLQVLVGFFMLYSYIGASFLVGVGIMLLIMVLTYAFTRIAATTYDQLNDAKDQRMRTTEEILQIIKFIKANTKEKHFFKQLNHQREREVRLNKKVKLMDMCVTSSYFLSSPLILSMTFLVHVSVGNEIDAASAFTTILLFQILQEPMILMPTEIAELVQSWSSLKRIEAFLYANDIEK